MQLPVNICCIILMNICVRACVFKTNLVFHFGVGPLRAELHLFLELLQCHISLLDLLPLALPGSVQLALHLPLNHTHTHTNKLI